MKHSFMIPVLCTAVLVAAGCAGDYNEDDHIALDSAILESVTIDDKIANDIRIIQTTRTKTESGVEGVCVRGRLKRAGYFGYLFNSYGNTKLSYKFTWIDEDGKNASRGQNYGWHAVRLFPGEEFACTSYAPAKGNFKVNLEIREGAEMLFTPDATAVSDETSRKVLQTELPAEIREGKATTTKEIKAKTEEVEKKNKALKKVNEKVADTDASKTNCKCGCAFGATCYCPDDSPCRAGKNLKTDKTAPADK